MRTLNIPRFTVSPEVAAAAATLRTALPPRRPQEAEAASIVIPVRLNSGEVGRPVMHDRDGQSLEVHEEVYEYGPGMFEAPVLKRSGIVGRNGGQLQPILLTPQQAATALFLAQAFFSYWSGAVAQCPGNPDREPPRRYRRRLLELQSSAHRSLRELGVDADYMVYGGGVVKASVTAYF